MKLNGKEYSLLRGDFERYPTPILKTGDKIEILFENQHTTTPGVKNLKKGKYVVKNVHITYVYPKSKNDFTYDLVLDRKNSTYVHPYSFIPIDKAINDGAIIIL